MTTNRLIRGKVAGGGVEAAVQFCDFCGETVYRTFLVRIGDGSVVRGVGAERQIRRAEEYRKACPGCAEEMRAALHEAEVVMAVGEQVERMVREGATQREIDEYVVGWGLGRELVKGFGLPEVDTGKFR